MSLSVRRIPHRATELNYADYEPTVYNSLRLKVYRIKK